MMTLFDMHCHLGFAENAPTLAADAQARGIGCFSVTVEPDEYERVTGDLARFGNIRLGVGLHPWWIADGRSDEGAVRRVETLMAETRFVGEVGLDFSPRHGGDGTGQRDAFARIARRAAIQGGKLLSLHAVRATAEVLDVLEDTGCAEGNDCIFHWFSGSSDELQRAIGLGCYFSMGQRMLASKRGREYAKIVPCDRLLLESDLPGAGTNEASFAAIADSLEAARDALCALRGEDIGAKIARTSACLLRME